MTRFARTGVAGPSRTAGPSRAVVTDPECIALESLAERTRRFVFDEAMLRALEARGLVEPLGSRWRVTPRGHAAMEARCS